MIFLIVCRENLVVPNASKTQIINLLTRPNLPNNSHLLFYDTNLSPSSILNNITLSLTYNLKLKLSMSFLGKIRLSILRHLHQFFSSTQPLSLLTLTRSCMQYSLYVWDGGSTRSVLLDMMKSKAFRPINSSPSTDGLQFLSYCGNVTHHSPSSLFSCQLFT